MLLNVSNNLVQIYRLFSITGNYGRRSFSKYGIEHIEIKTKKGNTIHFPYLDLSQNVKIRDVPYSLKSPRNSECKLAHISFSVYKYENPSSATFNNCA
jgi:hypothetical protein